MGFEAPHHKRVFDAVRPGPTHYIVTTQAHVDHVGGVDLFKEDGTGTSPRQNNQLCQADDARIRALRMRTAGIWFDTLGPTPAASPAKTPACRCAGPSRSPTSPSTSCWGSKWTASGWNSRRGRGDDRQRGRVAARTPHRAGQQSLRAALPPFPEPQHPEGGQVPLRRALSRACAPYGPATRGARHRAGRTGRGRS